nr:uncharacterized protein LOC120095996 isoform X3 [Rattus norvegicus]
MNRECISYMDLLHSLKLGRWGPGRSEGCKPRQQKTFSDARSHSSRCVYASRLDCRCPPDSSAIEKGTDTVFSGLWMSSAVPSTVADDGEVSLLTPTGSPQW